MLASNSVSLSSLNLSKEDWLFNEKLATISLPEKYDNSANFCVSNSVRTTGGDGTGGLVLNGSNTKIDTIAITTTDSIEASLNEEKDNENLLFLVALILFITESIVLILLLFILCSSMFLFNLSIWCHLLFYFFNTCFNGFIDRFFWYFSYLSYFLNT